MKIYVYKIYVNVIDFIKKLLYKISHIKTYS